jgi:hypothetical protein
VALVPGNNKPRLPEQKRGGDGSGASGDTGSDASPKFFTQS